VSTPSHSPRRFLSILPFNLRFRARSHLNPFALFFSTCIVRVNLHERSSSLHVWSRVPEPPHPRS
jgi:hypothetical protein